MISKKIDIEPRLLKIFTIGVVSIVICALAILDLLLFSLACAGPQELTDVLTHEQIKAHCVGYTVRSDSVFEISIYERSRFVILLDDRLINEIQDVKDTIADTTFIGILKANR